MQKEKQIIPETRKVKAYFYGRTIEMTNALGPIRKVTKVIKGHRIVNTSTGQVFDMDRSAKKRSDNLHSVKRTMRQLRRLIGANFGSNGVNRKNQLWITLTYKKDVNARQNGSTQLVYKDFKILIKKLRKRFGKLEYIAVLEPQASGRWHLHVLIKASQKVKLYIPNVKLEKLWGKGFTSTKRLSNSDNVAGYLMAYVSDLNLTLRHQDKSKSKRYIKGARLALYPKGVRIYRRSKGIEDPVTKIGVKNKILPLSARQKMPPPKVYLNKVKTKNNGTIDNITEFYVRRADHNGKDD